MLHVHPGRTHPSKAGRHPGEEGWWGCCAWRPGDRQLVREGLWVTLTPLGCNAANSPFSAFAEGQEGREGPGGTGPSCGSAVLQEKPRPSLSVSRLRTHTGLSPCRPQPLPLRSPLGLWPLLSPGLSEPGFILITQAVESDLLGSNLGSAVS